MIIQTLEFYEDLVFDIPFNEDYGSNMVEIDAIGIISFEFKGNEAHLREIEGDVFVEDT